MARKEDALTEPTRYGEEAETLVHNPDNVVSLGQESSDGEISGSRPGRLHGTSIAGMAIFALIGIIAMFAFITVSWPGNLSRVIMATFVGAGIGFMVCASTAVFTAARDTYPRSGRDKETPE